MLDGIVKVGCIGLSGTRRSKGLSEQGGLFKTLFDGLAVRNVLKKYTTRDKDSKLKRILRRMIPTNKDT